MSRFCHLKRKIYLKLEVDLHKNRLRWFHSSIISMLSNLLNSNNMKKFYFFLTAIFLLASQFIFANITQQWEMLSTEDGVEFYISKIDLGEGRTKTLLKIKNNNDYEAKVSFYAVFPCSKTQTKKQGETVFVGANEMAIYTYQVCEIKEGRDFALKSIHVIKQ